GVKNMHTALYLNVTDSSLFNHGRKEEYLMDMVNSKNLKEQTAISYGRIFEKTKETEEKLNKDLSDFTFEEIEKILFDFKSNNRNTLESYARIISSYLNWNVKKGYIKSNLLEGLRPNDFSKYLTN